MTPAERLEEPRRGRSVTMSEELDAKRQKVIEAAREVDRLRLGYLNAADEALRSALAALEGKVGG